MMETDIDKALVSKHFVSKGQNCDITDITGGDGPWQRRIFAIIFFLCVLCAFHNLSMSFLAPNLDHWCSRPPEAANLSVEQWRSIAMSPNDQHCSRYEDVNVTHSVQNMTESSRIQNSTIPCDSWEYDETFYTSTVLSQWNLVCNRKWLVSLSKSVFGAGMPVSLMVFGYLSDRFGRKPVIVASAIITVSSAIASAYSTSFAMFIITRFFTAIGTEGFFSTPFVLLMEIVGPEYRSFYGIAIEFGWCLGFVSLPAIAWLSRDWFWIQVAISSPCLIFPVIWWIPESPRWLVNHGKMEDAQKVVIKAAKINGIKLSEEDYTTLRAVMTKGTEVYESGGSKGTLLDLVKTPGLWQITLNLYFAWFVNSLIYYGLSYNTNELAGNPFVNFALSGIVEFPAYMLSIFIIRSLGRRNPLAASMVISGVACLAAYLLPPNPWWLSVAVSMIGKFFITISFGIIYVFSAELFPTVVRNIGVGSASVCARFGSILAPFMRELGSATHPLVPQIIFGVLAVASGALVLLLPETNNCSVPDTVEEAADVSRRKRKMLKAPKKNYFIVKMANCGTEAEKDMTNLTEFRITSTADKNV